MATVREAVEEKRKKNKNNEEEKKTSLSVRESVEQKRNSSLSTNNTNKKPTFDYETGKKGWQKYLDDQSSAEQKKAKEKEDEKWWETLGRYLGSTGATDTTLSLGNTGQIINDVRNDTSYQRPSDDWSEEQQYQFGALYLESPGKAYSYAEKINNENNKAKEAAEIEKIQNSATSSDWGKIGHTAGAIATAPLGMADYLNMLVMANAGRDPSVSDGVVSPFEYSTAVTEGISTDLNNAYGTLDENIPIIGGKGWGDVYGLGVSIAQSAVSGYTLGSAGTLVSYFGQGAASGMKDALERGADEGTAALYGAALGAIEGIAESIGIDNLFKIGSSSTVKGLLKNILNQAKAEGMEELLTSVCSNIIEDIAMKGKSNFYAMVSQYMALGLSEEEAKKKAWWDSVEGIAFDAIAGFVSGGVHGGASTTIQTGISNYNTNKHFGNQAQDIVNDALNSPHSDVQAIGQKYQNQLDSGKKLSGWNLNELIEVTDTDKIKNAVLQRLGELGETSDVTAVADVLVKEAMGGELSSRDITTLNNSKYGHMVSTELNKRNIKSGGLANMWSENIGTRMVSPEVYNKGRNAVAEDMPNKIITKGVPEESKYKSSESGKTTLKDQEVSIQGIESIKGGEVTVRLENGDVVNASDLEFGSQQEALMYDIVARMDASPETANSILSTFKPTSTAQASMYYNSVPLAYEYGKIGYEAGLKNINLPKAQKNAVYTRGRIDAMIQAEKNMPKTDSAKKGSVKTNKKGIIFEGGYKYHEASASPLQKASMQTIEFINAVSNLEVHIYESKLENGKRVAYVDGKAVYANGYFKDGNKIYIDINAGQHGEGLMLDTLGHEVTHYIRENDAKGFKAIADFLIEQYGKKGVNVEALLEGQRKKIRDRYAREDATLPSDAKLNDMAYEELVADAMSEMLSDPKAYDKLAKLKQQNRSAWETLRDAIKNILDKIKSILDQYKSEKRKVAKDAATPEANAVRDFSADAYEKLQDLYIKAFVEADANYEAMGEKHLKNKDVLFNLRAVETHKSNLEKQYSNDASISLETLTERYNKIIGIWEKLGGELNSKFLNEWNNKVGKDRAFTVFKAQAGYKYNVELSSMCKKGVPLFEAIDTIVKEEVMKELDTKVIGKEEKEILYDLLKTNNFEIPCAICYVEQARQREGVIIDAFLNGKIEKNNAGKTTTFKLGWNEVLKAVEKEMKANGVDYTFHAVDRSIATDKYVPADISMDEATQDAFYNALKKVANKEIARYNKAEGKNRKLVTSITPAAIKEVFKGTLPSNLKIFKVLFTEPSSRFTMESDLLYSSMTTHNLATAHNNLYSLFNSQGGVSGYKTKQGTVVYWGDILGKTWEPSKVRDEGGIRNQSNSDFQMYTLLDQVQMYVDFSAKGYYLQAYTKVLSELKLFGLSRGKINASLIPAVHVYHNADGSIDIETTRAYAGLDKNGNLLFDDIEGINHTEAFMLLEDAEYSKSIGGICIGYSDEHIRKLLDDKRVQQIIGFHDKTDDPDKRYKGAKYAKNYNGLNEAINNKDGKTVHLGFNPYVRKAEKMFTFDAKTETYEGEIEYNGKTYVADDIPKLAADLYLEMCKKKDYTPAYTDFDYHENYYKLLADFSLYDSQGHYAPHRKVAFNMPDSVPYLDINGKKKYMPTKDYIKAELEKELKVRDSISEALADKSETGLIPQFVKRVNESKANQSETKLSDRDSDYLDAVNRGDMVTAQRMVDEAAKEAGYYSPKLYHGTKMFGFTEVKTSGVEKGVAWSPFFAANKEDISATYVPYGKVRDISSTMDEDAIEEARETAIEERRETISDLVDDFRSLIDRYFGEWVFGQSDNSYLESLVENANPEAGHGDGVYDVLSDIVYDAFYDYQDEFVEYEDADDWYENSPEAQKIFSKIIEIEGEKSALYRLESDEELGGIYQLYANLDNMYVVDGKGAAWNELHPEGLPKIERGAFKDVPYKTRDVAEWARDNGFDGVIFKNIKDNGAYGRTPAGDVYAFFRPESQVKSADPVTYDNKGKVIPLSERFDAGNNDIRYSDRVTDEETLEFLDEQIERGEYDPKNNPNGGYYVTYKSMTFWGYDEDGNAILRSPMAEYVDGKLSGAYLIPKDKNKHIWYQATETIDEKTGLPSGLLVKTKAPSKKNPNKLTDTYLPASENQHLIRDDWSNLYFILKKKIYKNGKWENSDVPARYNPYEHSSNSMLNDQFSVAYARDNLVTVKMYVPVSEDNGTYRAKWSKDATGWADWKTGVVAGKIGKQKDLKRRLYLSRYATPVAIVPDSEVAQAYKGYLEETDVAIPDNVVPPNLLNELKKIGVPIERSGMVVYDDTKFQERDSKTTSNRTLLANALETAAKTDKEKEKLKQYKTKIALIESEQARLTKIRAEIKKLSFAKGPRDSARIASLQETAAQIESQINKYDRQLLNLESTEALKDVLQREKQMAYKKAKEEGREALKRQKEKDAETVRTLLTHHRESRMKSIEGRNKTAMRAKIKKVVSELNQLLLHGSKERNVKLGLQEAVAAALDAINMDTVGADERIAKYNALIAKANDPDVIASLKETRDRIKMQGDSLGDKLKAMKEAYYAIQHGEESKNYPAYFKEEATLIEQRIQNVIDKVGNTSLRDMSLTQLDLVYDMYKLVLTTIRNANKVWKEGKALDLQDNASAVMTELEEIKELGEEGTKIGEHIRSYSWNEMTPYYAFDRIGSKTLKSFFMETIRGQNVYARDVAEAKAFADKIRKKYDYTKWDLDKVYEFKLKDGRTFQVTLKHMLSIYAYSKREQALPHMSTGGFFFNDKSTFRKKGGIIELIRRTDSGYKIDAEILAEINEALGDKVNYVDEMQDYLTKMGEKGNEVTRTLWGIDLFKEKVYFPLKSMSDFIKKSTETAQSVSLKNDGMTKETVPGANNPIVLEAFDDVWASHIDRMSQYHAFVIPIDNLNKIHQYGTWAETESMAVSTMLTGRFGSAVNEYITQFIKDLNGNVVNPGAKNPLMGFLSKFKKTAVGASLSTVVQQPTAVLRAMADINAKYFIGKPNTKKLSNQWEELKQYAPIAIIKDIGGFDAGSGVQVSNWLNSDTLRGVDKVMNTIDDISMKGAEIADQLGWTSIWEAVKREISATTNLKAGSEEFLKKAGERFTEVIVRTQVYDSTLSRSGFMRSKSDTMKMLTAFMGEPTLSMNMMFNAIINAKRGGSKKQAVRTIGFTYASIIAASALSSLIYALRDDDDDESYLEKYMESLGGEFISDVVLAPVTSLPAVKDIVSIFQGWDVERTDVAIFKDIKDAFDGLSSETKSPYRKVEDFAGAIASAFGLPLKNVLRTGREIYNAFSAITDDIGGGDAGGAFIEGITGKGQSKPSQLYKAIINGDDARIERIKSSYKDESSYLNAVKTALRENDSRIHEAAQARLDGNISEYTRIAREIIAEGHFSQDTVVAAINSEMSAIKKGESTQTESTDSKDEATSIYRADDINVAFDNGDTSLALSIIDELVEMKMANGMDEKKAKSSLRSSMTSYWKPLYKQAYASGNTAEMQRIKQILYKSGLYGSATEVIKDVNSWLKN